MKKTGVFLLILLMFLTFTIGSTEAQENERWFVSYQVIDLTSKQLVLERDFETDRRIQNSPMFAGAEYNITVAIDVGLTAAYADLDLTVRLAHADSIDRYWEIHTTDLNLTEDYNPNSPEITFRQVKGRYSISTFGRVPSDLTITDLDQFALHKAVNHTILMLRGPDGSLLDSIRLNIIDSEIDSYRFFLDQRKSDLNGFGEIQADPAFIGLYESFIMLAEAQAEAGLVQISRDILDSMEVEIAPVQTGPSFQEQYFLPAVGVPGLLAVLMGFLFFKARGRVSFTSMVLEDQIRELEGLSLRASRTDRNLGARLQEINDRLKELERV